jgi:hypothetical protein
METASLPVKLGFTEPAREHEEGGPEREEHEVWMVDLATRRVVRRPALGERAGGPR